MSRNSRPLLTPVAGGTTSWAGGLATVDRPASPASPFPRMARAGAASRPDEAVVQRAEATAQAERVVARERALSQQIERLALVEREMRRALMEAQRTHVEYAVDLALIVAEELVRSMAAIDPKALIVLVEDAVHEASREHGPVVRLSPADHQVLEAERAKGSDLGLSLVSDADLSPGDCMVETPDLLIDGSVRARLTALRHELVRVLTRQETEDADVA